MRCSVLSAPAVVLCALTLALLHPTCGPGVHADLDEGKTAAWFPTAEGWTGKIKPFWFGANHTGLDSVATLALMAKHSVVGYGWQTGGAVENGAASVGRGDSWGASAVSHAADYMRSHGHNNVTVFQYREIQIAIRLYAQNAIAADNPVNDLFWLRNDSGICLATAAWGTLDPFWNFSNPDATRYWVDNVIGELTTDDSLTDNAPFAAVFFDEVDREYCGYSGSHTRHCNFEKFNNLQQQTDSIAMLPQVRSLPYTYTLRSRTLIRLHWLPLRVSDGKGSELRRHHADLILKKCSRHCLPGFGLRPSQNLCGTRGARCGCPDRSRLGAFLW